MCSNHFVMFEEAFQFAQHPPMPATLFPFFCGFWGNHYFQNLISGNHPFLTDGPFPAQKSQVRPGTGGSAGDAAQARLPGGPLARPTCLPALPTSRLTLPRVKPPLTGNHLLLALLRCREWSATETRDASPGYTCPPA